jgi:guanine nucleotide-binding protein G(i) subunit alpha
LIFCSIKYSLIFFKIGGKDYEKAVAYLREKFLACNQNPKKHIYHHVTCATDTQNVKVVFEAVKDIILHQVLDDSGLAF